MKEEEISVDVEKSVDLEKRYSIPENIKIVSYAEKYLAVNPDAVSWLVLNDDEELEIFKSIKNKFSISEILNKYQEESAVNVITQIEAKKFENPKRNFRTEKTMYIYLTNRCNLRCKHCYMFSGDSVHEYKELTPDEWINIINDFKSCGGIGITFTGGEVCVYNDFEKIIKHSRELGLKVTVLTNGLLWPEEKINELSKYIDEVQISIDGYDEKSYYDVRQYDGFSAALQCAKRFYKNGVRISLAVTPLHDNLDNFIKNFEPFAKKLLEDYPDLFIKLNLELLNGREVNLTPEENKEYKTKLKNLVEKIYPNYYTENFVLNFENHEIRRNCGFGGITLAPNGDVFWCNRIFELKSEINILQTNFKEVFEKSEEIQEKTSVDNTKNCKNCEIKYICGGGCRINYSKVNGDLVCKCPGKSRIYDKMIASSEYFFEE